MKQVEDEITVAVRMCTKCVYIVQFESKNFYFYYAN